MAVKKYSGKCSGPANAGPLLHSQDEKMGLPPQTETWKSVRRGKWRRKRLYLIITIRLRPVKVPAWISQM